MIIFDVWFAVLLNVNVSHTSTQLILTEPYQRLIRKRNTIVSDSIANISPLWFIEIIVGLFDSSIPIAIGNALWKVFISFNFLLFTFLDKDDNILLCNLLTTQDETHESDQPIVDVAQVYLFQNMMIFLNHRILHFYP